MKNILYLDDQKSEFRIFELECYGLPVFVDYAYGESESRIYEVALKMLSEKEYDIVFIDWHMLPCSGLSSFIKIRENFPEIPIWFVSNYPPELIREELDRIGYAYSGILEKSRLLIELQKIIK